MSLDIDSKQVEFTDISLYRCCAGNRVAADTNDKDAKGPGSVISVWQPNADLHRLSKHDSIQVQLSLQHKAAGPESVRRDADR